MLASQVISLTNKLAEKDTKLLQQEENMLLVDKMKNEIEKVKLLSTQVNNLETMYHTQLKETAAKH